MSAASISPTGWQEHNIWQHTASTFALYERRAKAEEPEMDCAAQAAELLSLILADGDSLIDMGCGTGWFWHSLAKCNLTVDYHGIDATQKFVERGKDILPAFGLPADHLHHCRAEDFSGSADHFLSMNFLSNLDNYHRILSRMLNSGKKSVLIRESISDHVACDWVRDDFLDPGTDLYVPVHVFDRVALSRFAADHGFDAIEVTDRRCANKAELVIGYPHFWRFMMFIRQDQPTLRDNLLKGAEADGALHLLP